jgi:cytochrome c553
VTYNNTHSWKGAVGVVILGAAYGIYAGEAANTKSAAPPGAVPCQACHGAHGEGMTTVNAPRIAGQSAHYIEKQLRDFASGTRENLVMGGIAKSLSDADRAKVAAYYASLPVPPVARSAGPSATVAARGHEFAVQGVEAKHVQACDNCHGPEGSGVAPSGPYLAGQMASYLASQLKSWQQGTRRNDAGKLMALVAVRLDETDIEAVTAYYASLDATKP